MPIYSYHYGAKCACGGFVRLGGYETNVYAAMQDVDLRKGASQICPHCGTRRNYYADELVYSAQPDKLVPLNHDWPGKE